ncbi:hypothetical protein WJX73_002169 [Symbiochloris irregularis]|uniref:RCC1-like domain-containing protein n=1 Tax=Symbiochloris irregularis TaxID=706552 RepID=A0AAW1NT78_9CHLO
MSIASGDLSGLLHRHSTFLLSGVRSISSSGHLKLLSFGSNAQGALGLDSLTDALEPEQVPLQASGPISHVAAGDYHSLATLADGSVWTWGRNSEGQLGHTASSTSPTYVPKPVQGLPAQVACGWGHALALLGDGTVVSWGYAANGRLGHSLDLAAQGSQDITPDDCIWEPKPVPWLSNICQVACTHDSSVALAADGSLHTFGANDLSQLGRDNDITELGSSSSLVRDANGEELKFAKVAAGLGHSLALARDGRLGTATTPRPSVSLCLQVRAAASSSQAVGSSAADLFTTDKRPIILYDGVCNMCNGGVNAVLNTDDKGAFRLAALQSETGKRLLAHCGRARDDISSIVLVEENRCHIKSDAILKIGQGLNLPIAALATLASPLPGPLRDVAYDQIAKNRYNIFGKTDRLRTTDQRFEERFIS